MSLGAVKLYRASGSGVKLPGTYSTHYEHMRLQIVRATKRDIVTDTIYDAEEELIEISLTEVQVAQLLLQHNSCRYVPCEINRINGINEPRYVHTPKIDWAADILQQDEDRINQQIDNLVEKLESKELGKKLLKAETAELVSALKNCKNVSAKAIVDKLVRVFDQEIVEAVVAKDNEIKHDTNDI